MKNPTPTRIIPPAATLLLLLPLLAISSIRPSVAVEAGPGGGTADGSEQWGYVEVRPKAHMFWWLYRSPQRVDSGSTPWPIVLWLQGGPGASGVGIGNFEEVGPLDTNLKPRNTTWLQKADLLFVDNPVGAGFSYVENTSLLVTTDWDAAADLTTLLKALFNANDTLRKSPLYIVAESYGGKYAVTLGLSIVKAIKAGELNLTLGGIALGDTWISPEDFVFSWAPLLKDVSRLDDHGVEKANRIAEQIRQQLRSGQYTAATESWSNLETAISQSSNDVDFYNFMLDSFMDTVSLSPVAVSTNRIALKRRYRRYLAAKLMSSAQPEAEAPAPSQGGGADDDAMTTLMDGPVRDKLKIIPKNVMWCGQSELVFEALSGDFMKPRIDEVDQLLAAGVNVTVYNGQLDVICSTKGTEAWLQKLKWDGLQTFNSLNRTPLYCGSATDGTKAFFRSYRNLRFYWILGAGHFVPVDQPCIALTMLAEFTQSPAKP